MDLVEEHHDYDPMAEYGFRAKELSVEEEEVLTGTFKAIDAADAEALIPSEDVW